MPSRPYLSPVIGLALALAGCLGVDDEPAAREPQTPPEASLRAPVIAPAGAAVTLDASASVNRDGEALSYVFEFNDGTEPVHSTEAVVRHVFPREGLYSVRLRALDARGHSAIAVQDVAVRSDYPERPDFCAKASDCVVGDECEAGVCYSTGGALE